MTTTDTTTTRLCAYCGTADDLEVINPNSGSMACRLVELCAMRAAGIDPVQAVLKLARELAKLGQADVAARNAVGIAGSRERAAFKPVLGDMDRARLTLVLDAVARLVHPMSFTHSGDYLDAARAEYGCRKCGAIGRQECTTASGNPVPREHGTWGPRWHKGRAL